MAIGLGVIMLCTIFEMSGRLQKTNYEPNEQVMFDIFLNEMTSEVTLSIINVKSTRNV